LKFIKVAHDAGFKRAGVITAIKDKVTIEIIDTTRIDLPVCDNGKLLVDEEYVKFLVRLSNQKLEQTHERIKKLEKIFQENF